MVREFKYLEYLGEGSLYYTKPKPKKSEEFIVDGLNENWQVNKEDVFWTMYSVIKRNSIIQGWKIHVSTEYEKAQETLDIVSKILINLSIPFKHVKDKKNLFDMYSKHGNRIQAGKFITIYPFENEFIPLLNKLSEALKDMPKGPYILTDKRWKDSNVYFRYGAFASLENEDGVPCILDKDGNLIPDVRTPKFHIPDFITLPEEVQKQDEILNKNMPNTPSRLSLYNIEKVIRFSNAGGIYRATRKSDNKECVIKESRTNIGLDGQNRNSEYRLKTEYEALKNLLDVNGIVDFIDYFTVWESTFLVIEYVEGIPLYSWLATNYPYNIEENTKNYYENVTKIIENLEIIIQSIHDKNIAMCDLQTQNIMVNEDLSIKIIDFETSEKADNESMASMATKGFSNSQNTIAKDRDWYSLNRIAQFLFLPISAVYDIDIKLNIIHLIWVYNNFGEIAYKYLYNLQMKHSKKIKNFKNIFGNTYETANSIIEDNQINKEKDINEISYSLKRGLLANCNKNVKSLINGDIRQFEMDCGFFNLQNGGFGAVLALLREDSINTDIQDWINKSIDALLNTEYNNGYLTGRSGIACTLFECGYEKETEILIDKIILSYKPKTKDLSFRSGLAGIGIALISLYNQNSNTKYLQEAEKIASTLIENIDNDTELQIGTDWTSSNFGLLDGYSGISLYLSILYNTTKKRLYLDNSIKAIEKDIENLKTSENGITQLYDKDRNIAYPYLSNGSIGVGISMYILDFVNSSSVYQEKILGIAKVNNTRITIEQGLFDGLSGLIFSYLFNKDKTEIQKNIDKLELYKVQNDYGTFMPGRMAYRLSSDLQTGNSGVLLAINSVKNEDLLAWLPLMKGYTKK
ncbi:MAG: class III lanthionine synthetase LanKC [Defluviitaleaceae bacterium]|nr:class III lanthionine synthetase LanKC [Defluviitaleaceae bacterium]